MFYGAEIFNGDIGGWDVSKVTDMYEVFALAPSFNNDISRWKTSRVTDMSGLFYDASAFNQDISGWDLSSVNHMEYGMFHGAAAFNQNLCAWREVFPYDVAKNTFKGTACAFRSTPRLNERGPFCASDCLTPELSTTSPTVKPVKAGKAVKSTKSSKRAKSRKINSGTADAGIARGLGRAMIGRNPFGRAF